MIFYNHEIKLLMKIINDEQDRCVSGCYADLLKKFELERIKTKIKEINLIKDDGR